MPKALWISCYRSIRNPEALAAYAALAGPTIKAAGGRFLARGMPARVYDDGVNQRTVIVEWPSLEQAIAVHDGAEYKKALDLLGDAVERDFRIVEMVD